MSVVTFFSVWNHGFWKLDGHEEREGADFGEAAVDVDLLGDLGLAGLVVAKEIVLSVRHGPGLSKSSRCTPQALATSSISVFGNG